MSCSTAAYRVLLRLYPAGFREQYADEMLRDFEADRSRALTRGARVRFWFTVVADLLSTAPLRRREELGARIARSHRIAAWALRKMFRCWRRPRFRILQYPVFAGRGIAPPRLSWMDVAGNIVGLLGIEMIQLLAWRCSLDGLPAGRIATGSLFAISNGVLLAGIAGRLVTRRRPCRA